MVILENSGLQPPDRGEVGGIGRGRDAAEEVSPTPLHTAHLLVELTPAVPL